MSWDKRVETKCSKDSEKVIHISWIDENTGYECHIANIKNDMVFCYVSVDMSHIAWGTYFPVNPEGGNTFLKLAKEVDATHSDYSKRGKNFHIGKKLDGRINVSLVEYFRDKVKEIAKQLKKLEDEWKTHRVKFFIKEHNPVYLTLKEFMQNPTDEVKYDAVNIAIADMYLIARKEAGILDKEIEDI